ncbi:MAG: hypothetical protein ACNA8G_05225, partial [Gammaproteobacteria bacterium]
MLRGPGDAGAAGLAVRAAHARELLSRRPPLGHDIDLDISPGTPPPGPESFVEQKAANAIRTTLLGLLGTARRGPRVATACRPRSPRR